VKRSIKQSTKGNLQKTKGIAPVTTGAIEPISVRETRRTRLAIGALLTFYRLIREMSRPELAHKAGSSVSLLGMIENGVRLPTIEALGKLGVALELSPEQRLQLHAIAGYSPRDVPEAAGWEILPEDVLNGKPIFVRDMQLESSFQDTLDLDDVWMVTRRPMALHEPILGLLKRKLLNTKTKYVYFVDRRFGEEDFRALWFRLNLEADPGWVAKDAARKLSGAAHQLAFVLSPPTLCAPTHTLAIFNPMSEAKRTFGRTAIYQGDDPIGVYAMDRNLIREVISLLMVVYPDLRNNPGQSFPKDPKTYGSFTLVSADMLDSPEV
jgi:transcriptional regulator with XRE-family HTH domain